MLMTLQIISQDLKLPTVRLLLCMVEELCDSWDRQTALAHAMVYFARDLMTAH